MDGNNKEQFLKDEAKYIRVGDDYYKQISRVGPNGDTFKEWAVLKRQTIIDDHTKAILKKIPKYDAFCNYPNHRKHESVMFGNYNMYFPFAHDPEKGSIKWTMRLLRHVFGDQIEIGLDYLQLLYEKPTQILPVLCLVSYANQTGKTTFLNWLNDLFKNNAIILGNQDLQSPFNAHYGTKLIISVDESKIDKSHVLEKIKTMATSGTININSKFIKQYTIGFFGKIIMCSNYEDNFITAKNEDVRYWVRKLGKPQFTNYDIDIDLKNELPAFIHYLQNRQLKNKKVSRMWFNPDDLFTEALGEIKANSEETALKKLKEFLTDRFDDAGEDVLYATPTDIENIVFKKGNVDSSYIRRLLKNRLNMKPANQKERYSPMEQEEYDYDVKDMVKLSKTGTPFEFKRKDFSLNYVPVDVKTESVLSFEAESSGHETIEEEELPF